MKEMLKSKMIILFIFMVLGASFIATPNNKLDDNINNEYVYVYEK